jgi:hypothetical protein
MPYLSLYCTENVGIKPRSVLNFEISSLVVCPQITTNNVEEKLEDAVFTASSFYNEWLTLKKWDNYHSYLILESPTPINKTAKPSKIVTGIIISEREPPRAIISVNPSIAHF